ncbi:hypothetical protein Aab01nite_60470 [Paractinoplanes abujensis]|uniref:Uncharacterized protein n=1 Tax=Paractinoplanes abujensis TaxID=882441 RepID=A0A7W7G6Y9_9ACTN|nr:hypothetical protein [Actinoplanes abujensis]MBB4696461.1 hypothetical protein [Actinoplanes abujensis]GID22457.1 hypothetical protein Aab01nite_60470 [Actinoplanes abujensis]
MSTLVPPLFAGLVDDASLLPPSPTGVAEAVAKHDEHRAGWFAGLLGPLLVPASLIGADVPAHDLPVALVGDVSVGAVPVAVQKLRAAGGQVQHLEAAVARRGEDPQPGLAGLRSLAESDTDLRVYAEIPLSWGLLAALDAVARARADGLPMAPKFRVGGLAAELFPTPVELAAVLCACRDRELPFRLAAGLRHAIRHTDPETGFTHHGFLNVLAASASAQDGGEVAEVAEVLAATHPVPLVEACRARRSEPRPLFAGFGAANVVEPLTELVRLGLINGGYE